MAGVSLRGLEWNQEESGEPYFWSDSMEGNFLAGGGVVPCHQLRWSSNQFRAAVSKGFEAFLSCQERPEGTGIKC